MTTLSAALLLFLILDPLGNIPVFLGLLKPLPGHRRRRVLAREMLIALGVLFAFLWAGKYVLDLMHLRQESVAIAGGIVLGVIGLRMVFPRAEGVMGHQVGGEPFIVPLAVPLIAGPSAMTFVILLSHNQPGGLGRGVLALLLAWLGTAVVLLAAPLLLRLLEERGLQAVERLMGMLLIMLAVQMALDGLAAVGG